MIKLRELLALEAEDGQERHAIAVFERHIQEVTRLVPAQRLLVYEVREGWGPLCRFLDVPVPGDTPFPRLNNTAAFQRNIRDRAQTTGGAS